MTFDDRVTFDHQAYANDHDPIAGRFVVAVLLPHKLRSKEEKGYLLVLSHREPGRSSVDRFPVHHDHLPGDGTYDDPKSFPEEAMGWIHEWAAERVEVVVNERRAARELEPTNVDREDVLGGVVEDGDVKEELRAFFLRPGADDFLGDVDREASDVATWLRTHAPEHSFEITPVVPPTSPAD